MSLQCDAVRPGRNDAARRWALAWLLAMAAAAGTEALAAVDDTVTLRAMHQQWVAEDFWCGIGDVEVLYQDVKLRCDEVEVDLAEMTLSAQGNVVLDQGDTRLTSDRLEFDLRRKVGRFFNVEAFFPPSYHFKGEELEKLDPTHYRFVRGTFTSCTLGAESPPWQMDVREAVVEMEGYGHFRGVALKVRGVPVLYTPRFLWPVKRDRAAGMLVPTIGFSNTRGAYLGNAFYWPITRSFDTTLDLDAYSKGFLGLGQEFRWAPAENAVGETRFYEVRDKDTGDWEWRVSGKHNQLMPGGYALRAELQDLSDLDFWQRFEGNIDRTGLRTLYSYVALSRVWGPQAANVKLDHRKTFFSSTGSQASTVILERRPSLEYRLRSTRITATPFYLGLVASADNFRINRSPTLKGTYSRFDLFPTLSLLTPGLSWLNVTPIVGARETYYTAQYSLDRTRLEKEPLERRFVTAGLSVVGPSFSRVWTTSGGGKVKHLVEPRLEYSYLSDPGDVSRTPVFDEKDSVLVTNRLRWTLSNRLFVKASAGSREVATFEIFQDYSFSDPLSYSTTGHEPSQRGPLSLWLRTVPVPGTTVDVRTDFDAVTAKLRSTALSASTAGGPANLSLTWYASYDPTTGKAISSQTRAFAALAPLSAPWRLETQVAYDIEKHRLLEQRYGLRWRGSCWAMMLELRDYRIEPYKARDYRLVIDLTGIGTFLDVRGGLDASSR